MVRGGGEMVENNNGISVKCIQSMLIFGLVWDNNII